MAIDLTITLVVFGMLGWLVARRRSRPVAAWMWGALGVATVAGLFVGVSTRLVSVLGIDVFLNWAIVSFCIGLLTGLLLQSRRTHA